MNIKLKIKKLAGYVAPCISWISWRSIKALFNHGVYFNLKSQDWQELQKKLSKDYYIILTRNNSHLSTHLVTLGHFFLTGQKGYWSHALMNLEQSTKPDVETGFQLIEATATGVHHSNFYDVFECDSVALLRPVGLKIRDWTSVFESLLSQEGKKYDNFMDLKSDKEINCVELVRRALQTLPNYETRFENFEKMIQKYEGNLTPDMFYNCKDFVVVYEARR